MDWNNDLHRKNIRRLVSLLFSFSILLTIILAHIGYIQLFAKNDYQGINLVSKSIEQRSRSVTLDIGRGDILDRKGLSFTGFEREAILVLPKRKEQLALEKKQIEELASILTIDEALLFNRFATIRLPELLKINQKVVYINEAQKQKIEALKLSGIFFADHKERYTDEMIARHVVGFIGQDPSLLQAKYKKYIENGVFSERDLVGKSGLERTYELDVKSEGDSRISYYIYQDRNQQLHPYYGLGIRLYENDNPYRPAKIVTTLDFEMQQSAERLLDSYQVEKGSIVVQDMENGDVLVMASRPNYNPNQIEIEKYNDTKNRAVAALFPGSVFKIVIAAAALEEGIVSLQDRFDCEGHLEFANGEKLKCWKEHGHLSLIDAFAESCNVTFAKLAIEIGRDKIEKYAQAFGLGSTISYYDSNRGIPQIYQEEHGQIFRIEGKNEQLIANTAIGQQDVQITPLQASNMLVTIMNHGRIYQPRLVQEIRGKNGYLIQAYHTQYKTPGLISRHTFYQLSKLLEAVVQKGTATTIGEAGILAGGKTGTAEIGKTGNVHRWFVAYYPANKPKYSISIVVEDVRSYEQIGTPTNLFKDFIINTLNQ
ncbi:hypothetical protein BHU72_08915 [Desulfuribacillus stibiiarsenatis]|uniref:Penicillin-binding protein transpeptidase domain-containing protein n=1 Tax=Desulfuribacillus stibiiarsenatis TaxID=1390249 RepID=A0A1E5L3E8_9FIRM|nr:penicillin-binding protein 2 [Desulfuribacillus stibiiarsenatis]OEH84606.1 hypothetical protein BHU72_08915 [Desulfuribacillus stibiiarsenatis]